MWVVLERVVPAAEPVDRTFDDTKDLGDALALLVGDLPAWRKDGERASLAARLAFVDSVLWEHFCLRVEALAFDPETERTLLRRNIGYNWV